MVHNHRLAKEETIIPYSVKREKEKKVYLKSIITIYSQATNHIPVDLHPLLLVIVQLGLLAGGCCNAEIGGLLHPQ